MTLQRYAGESEKIWKKCLINEKNIGNYGTTESFWEPRNAQIDTELRIIIVTE